MSESISVSREEAKVIASLLDLYDSAYGNINHRKDCDCCLCTAFEKAGDHQASVFDSLEEKCKEVK